MIYRIPAVYWCICHTANSKHELFFLSFFYRIENIDEEGEVDKQHFPQCFPKLSVINRPCLNLKAKGFKCAMVLGHSQSPD